MDITYERQYGHEKEQEEDQDQEPQMKPNMGVGKIQRKLIENHMNRLVTYSKRRTGLFKKAHELSVLCDAKVSLIMINNTKVHEYCSPNTTTKEMFDLYQKTTKVDLWEPQYEKMKQELHKHKRRNYDSRREIRQMMGCDLSGLNFQEICDLEWSMSSAVEAIRVKKLHHLDLNRPESKQKFLHAPVKGLKDTNLSLLHDFQAMYNCEDPPRGLIEDDVEGKYDQSVEALAASNPYAFRHKHQHDGYLSLELSSGSGGFDSYADMRNHLQLA